MNTEVTIFNPKEVGSYGNKLLSAIVAHEERKEFAETEIRNANEREKVIDFELTRVAMYLHTEEKIDLYTIYADGKDTTSKLYRAILKETGVLEQKVIDDAVLYEFVDPAIRDKFYFNEELKQSDEEEFKRRRSRRNALNIRLARVCKAAIALIEAKATEADMQIVENKETGELQAVITKGPKEVMGKAGTVQIVSKSAAPVEGATATPTISGLAKLSDTKHKTQPDSKNKTEATAKGTNTSADFTASINVAIMAVKGKEGEFTQAEKNLLSNLLSELEKALAPAKK